MLLGCLISATDHVVVVAHLKEINAEKRLATLLKGETLLNEAMVLIIFNIALKSVSGDTTGAGGVTVLAISLILGGCLIGIVAALMMTTWLKRIINDSI